MQPPSGYLDRPPSLQELALTLAIAKLIANIPPEELQNAKWFKALVFAEQNPEGPPEIRQALNDEMKRLMLKAFHEVPTAQLKESLAKTSLSEFEQAKVLRSIKEGDR